MEDERFKQLMIDVGMPDSLSLLIALRQVANEVAQECAKKNDGWISVEEELPPHHRPVIVSGGCGYYDDITRMWHTYLERYPNGSCCEIQWDVKHWQHLPPVPEGE